MVVLCMNKPRAILFDWDNTLADTWDIIHSALERTFKDMNIEPFTKDEVKSGRDNIHHSLRDSFPKIFGDRWEEARSQYYKHFLETHLTHIKKLPEADSVLNFLKSTNIPIGIVSNKTGNYLRQEVEHLGWRDNFRAIVGATDAEKDKPHPEPVYKVLNDMNIEGTGADIWLIGDSQTDIDCASNANISSIKFGNGLIEQKEGVRMPISSFNSHSELLLFLENILG
jgi:phosphoglycolate phosphatase